MKVLVGEKVQNNSSRGERAAKRVLDILCAGAGLVILSPLLGAIAAAIKLADHGAVFYPWRVVGEGGQPFTGYKFRTMVMNADELKAQLLAGNEMSGPVFKLKHDPRITPIGRILRRYSLDELPQLWSVLKGDMSLVGPRPPLQTEYAQFTPWQQGKLAVKPGITCLWQISGRSNIQDFDEWVRLDLEYVQNWSLWLDIRILLRTIPVVVFGKGAW